MNNPFFSMTSKFFKDGTPLLFPKDVITFIFPKDAMTLIFAFFICKRYNSRNLPKYVIEFIFPKDAITLTYFFKDLFHSQFPNMLSNTFHHCLFISQHTTFMNILLLHFFSHDLKNEVFILFQ